MPPKQTRVEADGLGDWRMQAATRLAAEVPSAYPGGPSHKAGAAVYLTTMAAAPKHRNLGFPTPSATALTLDAAFRSASSAAEIWPQIRFSAVTTPDGPGTTIAVQDAPLLFDYFAASMAAAGSSFQAIEAFANETISRSLKGTVTLERRKGPETLGAEEIERQVSTEEKIATIVPQLHGVPSIKGTVDWQHFVLIKNVRDSSFHFKSGDQYPSGNGKVGKESLYYILLNHDARQYPLTSLRVIWLLRQRHEVPRWLKHLAEKHGVT